MAVVTNLVADPGMEVLTDEYWLNCGSPDEYAVSTEQAFTGTKSHKITTNATNQGISSRVDQRILGLTPGGVYYISFHVYGAGVWTTYTEEYDAGGSVTVYQGDTGQVTANASWQRRVQPVTLNALSVSTRFAIVTHSSSAAVVTAYIDGVMFSATNDDYFDGDTTDGGGFNYAWTGTAHNSTSTKTTAGLSATSRMRRSNFELRPAY
jgi:hypothetical protein